MATTVLVKYKSPKDHNWRMDPVSLERVPVAGDYIAVGNVPEMGCKVNLVLHRPSGSTYKVEVYGEYVELEEATNEAAQWEI